MILGSTGSIGTQALDVVRGNAGRFSVSALAAGGGDAAALAAQARDVAPLLAADPATLSAALRDRRENIETQIRDGEDGRRRSRQ